MTANPHADLAKAGLGGYDISLTDYADVIEAMRSSKFVTLINDGTQPFRAGTVLRIEGPDHRTRRQTMGTLLRGDGRNSFHEKVVLPTIANNIDRLYREAGSDRRPRFDLVTLAANFFFQNAAALIGLDVHGTAAAEELRKFCEPLISAMAGHMEWRDREARVQRGVVAKQGLWDKYYCPALAHHETLRRQVEAGDLAAEDMPRDLLTLIVSDLDPNWSAEPELGMREALTDILGAGTTSSSLTAVWAVHDLLIWSAGDAERRRLIFDDEFLARAVHETLRLHSLVPFLWRQATEDATLASGTEVKKGQSVLMEIGVASRDESVFGPDADTFNPYRSLPPKTYPYGLAFGSGRHMCYGMPVVLGNDGVHGSHGALVKALFAAGISGDPDNPPRKAESTLRDNWATYPVILQPDAQERDS